MKMLLNKGFLMILALFSITSVVFAQVALPTIKNKTVKVIDESNVEISYEKTLFVTESFDLLVEERNLSDLYLERDLLETRIIEQEELVDLIKTSLLK